jgi:hypothetical protein
VFFGAIKAQALQYLDEQDYLRPSFYFSSQHPGNLMSRSDRDLQLQERTRSRGDARRRFTYEDLVWIRLLVYVKDGLKTAGMTRPLQRAGDIVRRLRSKTPTGCPPPSRLLFFGRDVYLLDDAMAVSLTSGQLGLTQLVTDNVEAEVKGRIDTLIALKKIRAIPTKCSIDRAERVSA